MLIKCDSDSDDDDDDNDNKVALIQIGMREQSVAYFNL